MVGVWEEIVPSIQLVPRARIGVRVMKQNENFPVPQTVEEILGDIMDTSGAHFRPHRSKQTVRVPVPHIMSGILMEANLCLKRAFKIESRSRWLISLCH